MTKWKTYWLRFAAPAVLLPLLLLALGLARHSAARAESTPVCTNLSEESGGINDFVRDCILIYKEADRANPADQFPFVVTGPGANDTFNLGDDGVAGIDVLLYKGDRDFKIIEFPTAGWRLAAIACTQPQQILTDSVSPVLTFTYNVAAGYVIVHVPDNTVVGPRQAICVFTNERNANVGGIFGNLPTPVIPAAAIAPAGATTAAVTPPRTGDGGLMP